MKFCPYVNIHNIFKKSIRFRIQVKGGDSGKIEAEVVVWRKSDFGH